MNQRDMWNPQVQVSGLQLERRTSVLRVALPQLSSPPPPPFLHFLLVHPLSLLVSHLGLKPTENCLMAFHTEQCPKLLGLGREQGAQLSYCPPLYSTQWAGSWTPGSINAAPLKEF